MEHSESFLRLRYEDRVRSLVALVIATAEAIDRDEVIAVMKGNEDTMEFAKARAREVWESTFAKEREATITSLLSDLSAVKRTVADLESQLSASRRTVLSAEEKSQELTRQTEQLYAKASTSSQNYEEIIRKKDTECAKWKAESEGLRVELGRLRAEMRDKGDDLENLTTELEENSETARRLEAEIESLRSQLASAEELQRFREKVSAGFQDSEAALQEKLRAREDETLKAGKLLRESQAAQMRLESQLKQQAELHKKQLDALTHIQLETQNSSEQRYESELQSLQTKLATSKQQVQEVEVRLQEAQRALSAIRTETEREKVDFDRRREMLLKDCELRESALRKDCDEQLAALHRHYSAVILERSKAADCDLAEEREKWKTGEKTLREKLNSALQDLRENYVSMAEHEAVLSEKDAVYADNMRKLAEELEDQGDQRTRQMGEKVRKDMQQVVDLLTAKLENAEAERDRSAAEYRKVSGDFQAAREKIGKLQSALGETQEELSEVQVMHSSRSLQAERATKEVEEMTFQLADSRRRESEYRDSAKQLQSEVRALHEKLRDAEVSHKAQLATQAAADREQLSLVASERDELKAEIDQLSLEVQRCKQVMQQIEDERDAAIAEAAQRESMSQEIVETARAEEQERTSTYIRVHTEVREKLSAMEAELARAVAEVERLQRANDELSVGKSRAEDDLSRYSAHIAELQAIVKQGERQHKEVRGKAELSRKALKSIVAKHTRIIRGVKQRYRTELTNLQAMVFHELQECQKTFSSLSSRCLMGVDDRIMALQRKYQLDVIACQEQTESLQRRLERSKSEHDERLATLTAAHEGQLGLQREEATSRLRAAEMERNALAASLDQARAELRKQEAFAREAQDNCRRLQAECVALKERSKTELDSRLRALEAELDRRETEHQRSTELQEAERQQEVSRLEADLRRERDAVLQFQNKLEGLQSSHSAENAQIVQLFKQKLTEKDAAMDAQRATSKQQLEEIGQLRSELLRLRKKTEAPLVSLHAEVDTLVEELRLEKARYRNQLMMKDKEIADLQMQLLKDTELTRSLTEAREEERARSDPRLLSKLLTRSK